MKKIAAGLLLLSVTLGGCAQQQDACAQSGYDQNVCADEQSRRSAAIAILGGMQQRPYQLSVYQMPQRSTTNCTSTGMGSGMISTSCY